MQPTSREAQAVRDVFDDVRRAFKRLEDGRTLKQDIYVQEGIERLKRALRDLEDAVDQLR